MVWCPRAWEAEHCRAPVQVGKGPEESRVRGGIIEVCSFLRRGSGGAAPSLLWMSSGRTRGNSWGCVRAGSGGISGEGSLPGRWLGSKQAAQGMVTDFVQHSQAHSGAFLLRNLDSDDLCESLPARDIL